MGNKNTARVACGVWNGKGSGSDGSRRNTTRNRLIATDSDAEEGMVFPGVIHRENYIMSLGNENGHASMTVFLCALAATRTPNLLLRKQALYPIELRGQAYRKVILPRRVSSVKISVFIPCPQDQYRRGWWSSHNFYMGNTTPLIKLSYHSRISPHQSQRSRTASKQHVKHCPHSKKTHSWLDSLHRSDKYGFRVRPVVHSGCQDHFILDSVLP